MAIETFTFYFLGENPAFGFHFRLGKSLVLFVRVISYIISTTDIDISSDVTVMHGDLR